MQSKKIGFAVCGSFCTLQKAIAEVTVLKSLGYDVLPIVSDIVRTTDTRFGKAEDFIDTLERESGNKCIFTIKEAEPIGPKCLLDALIIAPCTGNTLAKLACGIADGSVTMAAKAHLRNEKPLLIALSTNDALGASAKNIGALLNCKNVYFVPFGQDLPDKKHNSCIADFELIPDSLSAAFEGRQLQPILL